MGWGGGGWGGVRSEPGRIPPILLGVEVDLFRWHVVAVEAEARVCVRTPMPGTPLALIGLGVRRESTVQRNRGPGGDHVGLGHERGQSTRHGVCKGISGCGSAPRMQSVGRFRGSALPPRAAKEQRARRSHVGTRLTNTRLPASFRRPNPRMEMWARQGTSWEWPCCLGASTRRHSVGRAGTSC